MFVYGLLCVIVSDLPFVHIVWECSPCVLRFVDASCIFIWDLLLGSLLAIVCDASPNLLRLGLIVDLVWEVELSNRSVRLRSPFEIFVCDLHNSGTIGDTHL